MSIKLSTRGTLRAKNVGLEGNGTPDAVVAANIRRDVGNLTVSVKLLEAALGRSMYESTLFGISGPVAPNVVGEVSYEVGTKSLAASLRSRLRDANKRELELGATWTEKSGDFHLYADSKPHPNHKVFAKYSPARTGVEGRYTFTRGPLTVQPGYNFTRDIAQLQVSRKHNGHTYLGRFTTGKNLAQLEWANPQGLRVGAALPVRKGARRPDLYVSMGLDVVAFTGTTPALPADSTVQVKDAPLATAMKEAKGGKRGKKKGAAAPVKDAKVAPEEGKGDVFHKFFTR